MIKEISKKEFEERFPEVSTYGIDWTQKFLENGIILLDSDWNGEVYTLKENGRERTFKPVQKPISFDDNGEPEDWETIGYEEV